MAMAEELFRRGCVGLILRIMVGARRRRGLLLLTRLTKSHVTVQEQQALATVQEKQAIVAFKQAREEFLQTFYRSVTKRPCNA